MEFIEFIEIRINHLTVEKIEYIVRVTLHTKDGRSGYEHEQTKRLGIREFNRNELY